MQEYFAAEGCSTDLLLAHVEAATFDGITGISRAPWDEVILAKAALLRNADAFLDGVAQTNPYLAAEAMASGVPAGDKVRAALIEKLVAVFAEDRPAWQAPADSLETEAAIRSLGAIGAVEALSPIVDTLQINSTGIIAAACNTLADLGDPAAAQPLIDELGGWNIGDPALKPPSMRRQIFAQIADDAEQALVRLGPAAGPACIEALSNPIRYNQKTQAALLFILGRIGDPRAIDPILAFTETLHPFKVRMPSEDPLRAYAQQALGRLKAEQAIPMLAETLKEYQLDPDSLSEAETWDGRPNLSADLPLQAARALALIGTEEARTVLRSHRLPEAPVPIDVPNWLPS